MYRYLILSVIILISINLYAQSTCNEINKVYMKEMLGDAVYDNFRRTDIEFSKDPYEIEFRVDLLKNFVYKLIFDMSGKSEGVIVKLYDLGSKKKSEASEPKLLYTSSEDIMDKNAMFDVTFEAPKTRMLIKYEVKDATYKGCVTFVLGVFLRNKKPKTANLDFNN